MGWGTDFNAEIFLNRLTFGNKYQLEEKIREVETEIAEYEKQILMYCSSTPKHIVSKDQSDDIVGSVYVFVNEILTEYRERISVLVDLKHYLDSEPTFKTE